MKNDAVEALLDEAQGASHLGTPGSVRVFDNALDKIALQMRSELVGPILLLLNDGVAFQEAQYTAIHLAESVHDNGYVEELVRVLPELRAKAPESAAFILMRVLNSAEGKMTLIKSLRNAPEETMETVTWLRERLFEKYGDEPKWRFPMPFRVVDGDEI